MMAYLQAIIALLPLINKLVDLWVKTPAEKRDILVSGLHGAVQTAVESGDTSDLEKIISNGRS